MRFTEMTETQRNYVRVYWYGHLNDIIQRFHGVQVEYEVLYERLQQDADFQEQLRSELGVTSHQQVLKHFSAIGVHLFHMASSIPSDLTGLLHDCEYDEAAAQDFPF